MDTHGSYGQLWTPSPVLWVHLGLHSGHLPSLYTEVVDQSFSRHLVLRDRDYETIVDGIARCVVVALERQHCSDNGFAFPVHQISPAQGSSSDETAPPVKK